MSVHISCHCKTFTHELKITDDIPLEDTFCCCTSCRQRTGHLGLFPYPAPESDSKLVIASDLKRYDTYPETGNVVSTFFCGKCGSKVFIQVGTKEGGYNGGGWMIGCFDKLSIDGTPLINIHGYSWMDDTIDGGAGAFFKQVNGKQLKYYAGDGSDWKPGQIAKDESDYLNLHCRCSGFNAYVSRPNPEMPLPKNCWWYWAPKNDKGVPTRFMASWCACADCRGSTGSCFPAHPWVQIPFVDLHTSASSGDLLLPAGSKMTTETDLPGCTRNNSSDGVARYFCSTCGASVMYFDESRDFIGTWAVGLVDSKEGTLTPSWLSWWTGRDGHPNPPIHCKDTGAKMWGEGIMDDFEIGLVEWGKKVGQRS